MEKTESKYQVSYRIIKLVDEYFPQFLHESQTLPEGQEKMERNRGVQLIQTGKIDYNKTKVVIDFVKEANKVRNFDSKALEERLSK